MFKSELSKGWPLLQNNKVINIQTPELFLFIFLFQSDFYVFNIESNEWTQITDDTSAMGGPRLIFDHQMCMDVSTRTLYVFGGRVLLPAHNE